MSCSLYFVNPYCVTRQLCTLGHLRLSTILRDTIPLIQEACNADDTA